MIINRANIIQSLNLGFLKLAADVSVFVVENIHIKTTLTQNI